MSWTFPELIQTVIDKLESAHKHEYVTKVTAPTCTEKGYTIYSCACGDTHVNNYVNALGHEFGQWIVDDEASCTETGEQHRDCVRCQATEKVVIDALDHKYSAVVTKPTCTRYGFTTYTCVNCSDTYTGDRVEPLDHDFGEWEIEKEATCTERGEELRFCAACDAFEAREIEMTGHSFTDYISDDNATCTEDGTKTAVCDNCDGRDTIADEGSVTGHKWNDGELTKEPDIDVEGEKTYICLICGETKRETIPALPADPGDDTCERGAVKLLNQEEATCTSTGYSGDKVCALCMVILQEGAETPMIAHTVIVDQAVAATCTATGLTEGKHCFVCGEILIAQETVSAPGHSFGEWTEIAPATSVSAGEEKRMCQSCGIEEKRSIDKLVNPFDDVEVGAYYEAPVLWAVGKGITNGMTPTTFEPGSKCTRAQVVTFLWRASGEPEPTAKNNPFMDVSETDYFYKAVLWAVEEGITKGVAVDQFGSSKGCTRAQVATFLWRALGEPSPASNDHPFKDIKPGDYYYNAILWAVEAGVTNGMSPTTFAPDDTCTRGQIVTFLYRALK